MGREDESPTRSAKHRCKIEMQCGRCNAAFSEDDIADVIRHRTALRCGCPERFGTTFVVETVESLLERAHREATKCRQPSMTIGLDDAAGPLRASIVNGQWDLPSGGQ